MGVQAEGVGGAVVELKIWVVGGAAEGFGEEGLVRGGVDMLGQGQPFQWMVHL